MRSILLRWIEIQNCTGPQPASHTWLKEVAWAQQRQHLWSAASISQLNIVKIVESVSKPGRWRGTPLPNPLVASGHRPVASLSVRVSEINGFNSGRRNLWVEGRGDLNTPRVKGTDKPLTILPWISLWATIIIEGGVTTAAHNALTENAVDDLGEEWSRK